MSTLSDAVKRAEQPREIPTGVQTCAMEVWDREPDTGHPYVLGRITRETGQYGTPDHWRLHLLPDAKYGPDFLMQNDGRFATQANTRAEAERVLGEACEALKRWLGENARIKAAAWENIGRATMVTRDQALPLDGL